MKLLIIISAVYVTMGVPFQPELRYRFFHNILTIYIYYILYSLIYILVGEKQQPLKQPLLVAPRITPVRNT